MARRGWRVAGVEAKVAISEVNGTARRCPLAFCLWEAPFHGACLGALAPAQTQLAAVYVSARNSDPTKPHKPSRYHPPTGRPTTQWAGWGFDTIRQRRDGTGRWPRRWSHRDTGRPQAVKTWPRPAKACCRGGALRASAAKQRWIIEFSSSELKRDKLVSDVKPIGLSGLRRWQSMSWPLS